MVLSILFAIAAGTAALPNGADGVNISDAGSTIVGGTNPRAGNVISGNRGDGVDIDGTDINSVRLERWANLNAGDTGQPTPFSQYTDRSVQVTGAGTVDMQGSNDGLSWFTLNDTKGMPLTFTAPGLRQVLDLSQFLRPSCSAGTVTVNLCMRT